MFLLVGELYPLSKEAPQNAGPLIMQGRESAMVGKTSTNLENSVVGEADSENRALGGHRGLRLAGVMQG